LIFGIIKSKLDYLKNQTIGTNYDYRCIFIYRFIPNYTEINSYSKWFVSASYINSNLIGIEGATNPMFFIKNQSKVSSFGLTFGKPGVNLALEYYSDSIVIWWR
jgi:hypothetical protein